MEQYDVVYILKKDVRPDELRYSLRSLEKFMEFRRVWFYCGLPEGIVPDRYVEHKQLGASKWERARSSLLEACGNEGLTPSFWLFNDDFYLLQPWTSEEPLHRGQLRDHIASVEARHGGRMSGYTRQLRTCERMLKRAGLTTLDYTLHAPMLIDRKKMIEALEAFPNCPMFRSLYGNYAGIGGAYCEDNKVATVGGKSKPGAAFLSSGDKAFKSLQPFLEGIFPEPSRFEVVNED